MKIKIKKQNILALIMIIIISLISFIVLNKKEAKIELESKNHTSNGFISMMLQDDEGKYIESDNNFNHGGYRFNANRSKCLNGSKIKYQDNELSVSGTKSDKCYAYFDNNSFVKDLSGNGNNGKAINIASWDENGITTSDNTKIGYVNCGFLGYNFGNQLSVILRLKINKLSSRDHYFGNWEGGGFGFLSEVDSLKFQFYLFSIYHQDYTILQSKEDAKFNRWYTLVATYDNQKLKLYIDGILNSSVDLTGNIRVVNTILAIGGNPYLQNVPDGFSYNITSDALIFKRALTEEEIVSNYADKVNPTNKDDLLLWYKFN